MTINLITGIQSYYLQGLLEISSPQNHAFDTESLLQGLAKPHHLLHTQDYHGIDATISLIHNGKFQYILTFSPSHHAISYPL